MSEFSERLKLLREAKSWSQAELAQEVGVSKSAIGMYEQGRRNPDFETLEAFADIFNVDIDYLMGRSDKITVLPERIAYENKHTNGDTRYVLDAMKSATEQQRKLIRRLVDSILNEDEST